jgi:membrane-bound lytic murein transglycosylase D
LPKSKKVNALNFIFWLMLVFFTWFCTTANADTPPSVWTVLRQQFMLNHEINRPEVQTQLRWLMTHPSYLQQLSRAEPYIYHIINEIKQRRLPGEIALIPLIESSFDPFAYSNAGAAGLWQIMPETGSDYGLKRDWWFDGRRSIGPSTQAALTYFAYLNKFFNGNWILAFAAYDAGEGTISRIIKNSGQNINRPISFWSLRVPQETKAYIPRLLALAEIVQHPERYQVELPDIPHIPYFEEVNIGSQINLNEAAKLAGISYQDLIKLNPGFNHWTTAPYRPYKLLIPADKVEHFSRNLANLPTHNRVAWERHKVSAGEDLNLIAKKYHTSIDLIKELNRLKSNEVKKSQYVLVPTKKKIPVRKTARAHALETYKVIHIVQKRESLNTIAKHYGVSEIRIKEWNKLKTNTLSPGQALVLWKTRLSPYYRVNPGDTLQKIASTHHLTVQKLQALNPRIKSLGLKSGQILRVQ